MAPKVVVLFNGLIIVCLTLFFGCIISGAAFLPEQSLLYGVECNLERHPTEIDLKPLMSQLDVRNTGNVRETVNVTLSRSENGVITATTQFEIELDPDETAQIPYTIQPNRTSQDGDKLAYSLYCYVVEDEDVHDSDAFEATIVAAVLSIVDISTTNQTSENITIIVRILNEGSISTFEGFNVVEFRTEEKLLSKTEIIVEPGEEGIASVTIQLNETEFLCNVTVPRNGYYGENETVIEYSEKIDLSSDDEKFLPNAFGILLVAALVLTVYWRIRVKLSA